ncbi:hypothetical protein [Elizabethkingia meningoseptica]|uniref:hypothetical protein n=1 Tax=Elizabethkingia meningoseptica TaxID=238 RepID=UPI000841EBA8|nr:hypothetical protein [Elizabethkingia meningoseptica]ODM55411.1 hypothetical protein BES09_02900 [Elizabethkingia meningoseptica]OHT30618.1 hypothetical protein BFF93_02905 [Elizabethkingia meningoseptica]OPC15648.1 hypothetical protein BAX93_01010 [Elizabethkingia meningoseptica]
MSIINLFNYKSKILTGIGFVCMLGLFFSCSRELTSEADSNPVKLTFNIEGVENINPLAKTASKEPASGSFKSTEEKKINFDGFNATLSLEESPMSNTADKNTGLIKTSANTVQKLINPVAATLTGGVKYRVVLYDKSTNPSTFYSSTLGTAGTALSIPVEKGKNYDWAVFSFNDTSDPGTSQTTVQTDQRDLLHAASTTGTIPGTTGDGQMYNTPINVTLKHKLARIDVSVDATNYPATITNVSADLGSANYFHNGKMDLKTGAISNLTPNTTPTTMSFSGPPSTKTATPSYYTAGTTSINPFSIKNTNVTIDASGVSKSLSGATFNWVFTPVPGTIYTAKVNLRKPYDLNKFKILSVGSAPYMVDKSTLTSGVWNAMNSPANFGPSGTIPTINNWNMTVRSSPTYSQLYDLVDVNGNNNYNLVFIGFQYHFDLSSPGYNTANEISQLNQFVSNGGTVIWFTRYEESAQDLAVLKNFAGSTGSGLAYTNANPVSTNNNSALIGKFGDATNKDIYSSMTSYGITNYDPAKIDVLSTFTSIGTTYASAWKTKTGNFYYFGGGAITQYNAGFQLDANGKPIFGYSVYPKTANSVIIMNIVAKTLMSSQ